VQQLGAYSNCVNCTLSDRKCDTSSKCAKLDSENRQTGQISKLLHPISLRKICSWFYTWIITTQDICIWEANILELQH